MEERFRRCPKCLRDVRSSVKICSCSVNQAPPQLENKWLHGHRFNQSDSQLPQQELSILQDVRRDYLGERDYSGIPSAIFTNMNFDQRNFNYLQEPHHVPFAFKSQLVNEFVQSYPFTHENYRHSQASSQLFNDSLYKPEIPQPSIFSQLKINTNSIMQEKSAFHAPQRKTNEIAGVSGERSHLRNIHHFSDSPISNQPSRCNDFRALINEELNQPEKKYEAENEKHSILQILKKPEKGSYQNHPQELRVQPRVSTAPSTGHFSKERCASAEYVLINPSHTEFGHEKLKRLEKAIEMEHIGGYLGPNYANRDNSALSVPYLAQGDVLSLNRKSSFVSSEGTNHQTRSDYLTFTSSGSNISPLSSQPGSRKNWFECNASTNVDKSENSYTSHTKDANKFQGYDGLTPSSQEIGNFTRNRHAGKKYEEETWNRASTARSQNKKSLPKGKNLKTPSQVHSNERRFQCDVCTRSFLSKQNLTRHLRTHTKEKPHKCSFCKRSFAHYSTLFYHIRMHTNERPFQCNICKKRFKRKENMRVHIRSHTNERPHACDICGKRFNSKDNLNQHMQTHTNERPYPCNICSISFKRKSHLDSHILSHTNERLHACNTCAKRFNRKTDLNQYMQTHTNEKPYPCNDCSKRFKRKKNLNRHIRIVHTNERPYQCTSCSKTFKLRSHLASHIRSHTNERPYACDICDKRFKERQALKRHRQVHGKGKDASE